MIIQKLRGSNEKGFTLIELMIVIAIIGILAAIAIPNFLAYRTRGQNSAATAAAKNFYNQSMAYFADGHSGTVGVDELPGYNKGAEVVAGGTITDDGTGTVTVSADLTFAHSASADTMQLDADGNVSKM